MADLFHPGPRLRFKSFSSGSCGNCALLLGEGGGLLIDAGVGPRTVKKHLLGDGLGLDCIQAILLTHDHMDHVRSIGSFSKMLGLPVYATPAVSEAIMRHPASSHHVGPCRRSVPVGEWFEAAGFRIRSFEVPHDATQTVGYVIDDAATGQRVVVATDMGRAVPELYEYARTATTLVIESNYDPRMLIGGPYPEELKQRICRGHGHISNDACADILRAVYHPGLRNIFLCHLSENNNTPRLAMDCAAGALASVGADPAQGRVSLRYLKRMVPSPLLVL